MSYNGSGTFNINSAGQPVVTGTTITSTAFNLLTADLATGLSTAMTKDGQSTPTANIPMGTFKLTGLGAGTAATDAAQYGQLQAGATTIAVVTGTDTLTGTLTPAITAYATGNLFSFVAANTNTGAATIALNGLAAKNITKTGTTALAAGDIVSGRVYLIEYDGTRFQLLNPSASSVASFSAGSTGFTPSSATTGAVTLAGTLATTNGGTGLTSYTANGVLYASSSSALTSGSALTFDGSRLITGYTASVGTAYQPNVQVKGTTTSNYGAYGVISSNNEMLGFMGAWSNGENSLWISADPDNLRTSTSIVFSTDASEQMRLTSTGLGIGTSSPVAKLDVRGIFAISNNGASYWAFDRDDSTGSLTFTETATQRMELTASGNLGLGVTPSAWETTQNKAFNVGYNTNYNGSLSYNYGPNALSLATHAYNTTTAATTGWKYTGISVYAGLYQFSGSNGSHAWYTAPSGTAGNAITFTQAMTLTAAGDLVVGATSANLSSASRGVIEVNGTSTAYVGIDTGGTTRGTFYTNGSLVGLASLATIPLTFGTTAGTEYGRFDTSGNLLVGTTDNSGTNTQGLEVYIGGGGTRLYVGHASGTANGTQYAVFNYNATQIGSISQSGTTAVLYNVTSDYRLKNNPQSLTGAKDFVMALQPKKWQWWDGSGEGVGFIAHEFMEVAKYSGNGTKDAVDDEGKPIMQSIQPSSSEVMANLVSLIQEQQAIIESLKARLDAANL